MLRALLCFDVMGVGIRCLRRGIPEITGGPLNAWISNQRRRVLKYQMLGIIEASESAASVTKHPEDILMIDLDNQGNWKIMTKDQIDRVMKSH